MNIHITCELSNQKMQINSCLLRDALKLEFVPHFENAKISIDSRTTEKNDVFFAIKGRFFDGNAHAFEALQKGAAVAIVDNKQFQTSEKTILVNNTTESLKDLGAWIKAKISPKTVIGITGSVGKTTTRDWLFQILQKSHKVSSSIKNYNTQYGLPISLSFMEEGTEIGIFEIGTNAKSEVSSLSKYLSPNIAMITNILDSHIGMFGSKQAIAAEKISIIDGLPDGGILIYDADSEFSDDIKANCAAKKLKTFSVGFSKNADFFIRSTENQKITLETPLQTIEYAVSFGARHLAYVSACVVACLFAMDLDVTQYVKYFNALLPLDGRGRLEQFDLPNKSFQVIDDSYNASPSSMLAAIDILNSLQTRQKKIAIIGQMLELGAYEECFHQKIAKKLSETNIDVIFFIGAPKLHNIFSCATKCFGLFDENALETILNIVADGDMILLKGSHGVLLNRFMEYVRNISRKSGKA